MNKYKVEGRIRADIEFEEIVEATTEQSAVNKAEKIVYKKLGLNDHDIIDDEIYCERIENERNS